MEIRVASIEDAAAIRGIYSHYVTDTAVSFEYNVPSVKEFESRIEATLTEYPYFVATEGDMVVGYAYASRFRFRPAYSPSSETTIYIDKGHRRQGIGRPLYESVERELRRMNVSLMCACVAYTEGEDPYLTDDSIGFHRHLGFQEYGRFPDCAVKFGRPYGILWLCKKLSIPSGHKPFMPFSKK